MKEPMYKTATEADHIIIKNARLNNLKNISASIPKNKIVVFTGVSGSGKSSVVFDTIAVESQRQLNDTFSWYIRNRLPKFEKPDVGAISNLSPAIVVDQKRMGGNIRSTVGTITDIQPLIRLLFSRTGKPGAGPSHHYSFNDPAGMCPVCQGLGKVIAPDNNKLFDMDKSLNEGAIMFPPFRTGTWHWQKYAESGLFDNNKPLKDFSPEEINMLLYAKASDKIDTGQNNQQILKRTEYEGVLERFNRIYINRSTGELSERTTTMVSRFVTEVICPGCCGNRLNRAALESRINGFNIADYSNMEISDLLPLLEEISDEPGRTVALAITENLRRIQGVGLGYLSLSRHTSTLSGGESQRLKMVKHMGSSLTGMTYIFDEPSVGLHPRDIHLLQEMFVSLRDKGNSVIIVEHDKDIIRQADHIIDMGLGAGEYGGTIIYEGNITGLPESGGITGYRLKNPIPLKKENRKPQNWMKISNVNLHNLKNVSTEIPQGVLTCVTGVAGSGKSSLISKAFVAQYPEAIVVDQSAITANIRSNPATYLGIMDEIRKMIAAANNVRASLFSFNSEGACPSCGGKGSITSDMAFMDSITVKCETCHGNRYRPGVLQYKLQEKNITEILRLTIKQALAFFEKEKFASKIRSLYDVGLGYLTLGQSMDTLSGGELQRVKLANELKKKGNIYVMDEPTTGLHMEDTIILIELLDKLVDNGNTIIVIEHNLDVIKQADWIIDIGPEGGKNGGQIIFTGTPGEIINAENSLTGKFLRMDIENDLY